MCVMQLVPWDVQPFLISSWINKTDNRTNKPLLPRERCDRVLGAQLDGGALRPNADMLQYHMTGLRE